MGTRRPFRATVYLDGHGEDGRLVKIASVSASTEANLAKALVHWTGHGYLIRRWENVPLPLEGLTDDPDPDAT